ncbi:MAG: glycosyltransferase [Salinibacterium sp.]|nr:glycosyltransferase [Salinibacterium sp.]
MTVRALFLFQRMWLAVAYALFRLRRRGRGVTVDWVVGVDEIATMVYRIGQMLPQSWTVVLSRHAYYTLQYDTQVTLSRNRTVALLQRTVIGPWIFADMLTKARGLLYVGSTGFLLVDADQREFEIQYARSKGLKVATYFVGDDIRSPRLMHELERRTGLENFSTHIGKVSPYLDSDEYDAVKKRIATVANENADIIFTLPTDQLSYLAGHTEPMMCYYPDDGFGTDESKFADLSRPVIVHAPSSPITKGTPLVRAAIERLREDGYQFEYVELTGASNDEVLATLRRAHIAMNQFYAFQPGVFANEAMAARCAVLMSADEHIEKVLPVGSNDKWLVTKHYEVYEKLKGLLDRPETIEPLARRGEQWVRDNRSFSSAGPALRQLLDSVLDGSYSGR